MITKKEFIARIILILLCLCIGVGCYVYMNQSYDPLARYEYADDSNRDIILEYLDNNDINYLINQHLKPEDFMDFIQEDGFELKNTLYYKEAKEIQDTDNGYIIHFVNRFRKYFSLDSLKDLLTYYSYLDLTTFYETELSVHTKLSLVSNPTVSTLVLSNERTVYKYTPSNLVEFNGYMVQSCMVEDLQNLLDSYRSVMNDLDNMDVTGGYLSYEDLLQAYVSASENSEYVDRYMLNAGMNEQQLGYTITLSGNDEWIQLLLAQENVNEDFDYTILNESLTEEMKQRIEWLEENAYRYGFVIRYPANGYKETAHWYLPFTLRYVGKVNAKKMQDANKCMEQISLSSDMK